VTQSPFQTHQQREQQEKLNNLRIIVIGTLMMIPAIFLWQKIAARLEKM
jgi:hypothetical protein